MLSANASSASVTRLALLGERRRRAPPPRARGPRRGTCRSGRCSRRGPSGARRRRPRRRARASGASIRRTPPRTSSSGPGFGKRPVCEGATFTTTRTPDSRSSSAETRSRSVWSMIATSSGVSRRTRFFVRRSSRAGPVCSTKVRSVLISPSAGTPGRRASGGAPPAAGPRPSCSMRVCVGSPGIFSTLKCRSATLAICGQVRDRDHLRALAEPAQRLADRVRRLAADARVDLVEDDRLPPPTAAIASAIRESSPPEAVWATGANGRPCVRADEERSLVGAGRAGLALVQLDPELALAEPDAVELGLDCLREGLGSGAPVLRQPLRQAPAARFSALASAAGCRLERIRAVLERRELRRAPRRARARSSPYDSHRKRRFVVGDPLELGLDLLEPVGLGFERVEEPPQLERRLAQAQLGVSQLVGGPRELRARSRPPPPSARSARPTRPRRLRPPRARAPAPPAPAASASSLTWRSRSRSPRSASSASGARPSVSSTSARSSASRASSAAAPWLSSSWRRRAAPSSRQAARSSARSRSCSSPDERVEDVELVRGPGETALLELAGHRDQPLAGRGEILARRASAPRVRASAAVGEHAPGEHEPLLVLGPELGQRLQPLLVEQARAGGRTRPRRTPRRRPGPTKPASPFAPSRRPIAWARIVFPAPVSPVIAFSPGPGSRSASRISTRFSIRSLRSKGLPVAAEEGRLGQVREEARLLAEPSDDALAGARARPPAARRRAPRAARRPCGSRSRRPGRAGTTSGRACSECGAMKVTACASRPQTRTGPPFERL